MGEQIKSELTQERSFCFGFYSSVCKYVLAGLILLQAILLLQPPRKVFLQQTCGKHFYYHLHRSCKQSLRLLFSWQVTQLGSALSQWSLPGVLASARVRPRPIPPARRLAVHTIDHGARQPDAWVLSPLWGWDEARGEPCSYIHTTF